MNKLGKILSKWNFKKIAIWYIVIALIAGAACVGATAYIYRERLSFAWQYSRLEEAADAGALSAAADKTAASSADVVDVLILDSGSQVTYSAKNSEFSTGTFELVKMDDDKKYLISPMHPDAVFQYVKGEEFMLKSIISRDFGRFRDDYDDDVVFSGALSSKTLYMLSRVNTHEGGRVYVITIPTSVPGGMTALKASAALSMLFFCVYWALAALWLYKDAFSCGLSPLYWGLIGLFTNLIGIIVYKIYKRSMAICPSCGAAQSAGHLYCSFCGTQLGARCSSCGAQLSPKDSFCHHCGSKIK